MNNRKKKPFKILAGMLCIALVLCVCSGYQASAETPPDFPIAQNGNQLLQAIAAADDGDTIGISDNIAFYEGVTVGAENKRITIVRMNENAFLSFTGSDSSLVQNIVFDGGNIESNYPMISSQCSLTVESSIFQNCICNGEGAALGFYSYELNIAGCVFKDNRAYHGGHVYIAALVKSTVSDCTFKNGEAIEQGGGLYISGESKISNSVITNNRANYGGGIYHGSKNCVLSGTKVYYNSANLCGSDYVSENPYFYFFESVAELAPLFEPDNLNPIEWEISNNNGLQGFKLILESLTPVETEKSEPENPEEPNEPESPENPDQPDTPKEPGENEPPKDEPETGTDKPAEGEDKPSEPETPPDDTQNKGDEQPPADSTESKPGESGSGNTPATPSDSTGNNGGNNTSNSTSTTTTTADNRTTDKSDNSRYSSTSDSNNTSTVNNYYTQQPETQLPNNQPEVQTIVVPVGNGSNGEPIEQTIKIESSPERSVAKSAEGMTLNVNVNVDSEDEQQQPAAIAEQQSGVSWYQAAVLCLLSAILVCLIRKR